MFGETVEVQTVIPVGTADEGKIVRTFVVDYIIKGSLKMFHKRGCYTHIVIIGNGLFQYGKVTGLTHVCACSRDKPKGIVIEAGSYIGISLLGKGLVLMIGASVDELC